MREKFNILVVDDNNNNLFVMNEILKDIEDVNIISCSNGTEALELSLKERINLILLDIQLPDIDGYEVAKLLKSKEKTMDIPIIFVTAIYRSEEYIKKGYLVGAVDYLFKPVNENVVISKVKHYINEYKSKRVLIHKLYRINDELADSRNKWKLLGEHIPSSVFLLQKDFVVSFTNDSTVEIEGTVFDVFPSVDKDLLSKKVELAVESNEKVSFETKIEGVWTSVTLIPLANSEDNIMLILNDISEEKRHEEDIIYAGEHDSLTGLYNRRFIDTHLDEIMLEENMPMSIILGDLVGLKLVNDAFGHQTGDELIIAAANALTNACEGDYVIRWGGDEFLIFLANTNHAEVIDRIKVIQKDVKELKLSENIKLSISLGYSTMKSPLESIDEHHRVAEDRMYLNKLGSSKSYKNSIIKTLRSSLEEKDHETSEHAERMKNLVERIALKIKLKQHEVEQLVLLTELHDIGKISISDSILLKPGPLTSNEWNQVKKHSEVGYRLCSTIPELAPIANVILSHHEKWDGTGYPQGLKGEDIPFLSRIITIVDSYDVMTNDRPYKESISHEEAIVELLRCKGTQFDPELVDVFIAVTNTD